LYGLQLGTRSNLASVLVESKIEAREQAELRRLFYVGMTRARDLLVLSGGHTPRNGRDSAFSLMEAAIPNWTPCNPSGTITLETGQLAHVVTPVSAMTRKHRHEREVLPVPFPSIDLLVRRRQERMNRWSTHRTTPRRVTPSRLMMT